MKSPIKYKPEKQRSGIKRNGRSRQRGPDTSERGASAGVKMGYVALCAFLALCFAGGGGSRADVQSLLFVRLGAVATIVVLLFFVKLDEIRRARSLLGFLGVLLLLMIAQMIPMPPAWWTSLPGHAGYAEIAEAAGFTQPWRPISVTPDLTLNSVLALLPPVAALIALSSQPASSADRILPWFVGAAIVSALVAVAQISTGAGGGLYLYRITSEGSPVGLFANRNHQAALLAITTPMLAVWMTMIRGNPRQLLVLRSGAFGVALFMLVLSLATGSRMGLALQVIGVCASLTLLFMAGEPRARAAVARGRWRAPLVGAGVLITLLLILLTIIRSRAESVHRLFAADTAEDLRFSYFSSTLRLAEKFFPFGSGFGSFDPVFREVEPSDNLGLNYFNHAHNDLVELGITGGLPALLLLALFLIWWGRQVYRLWFQSDRSRGANMGRLGSVVTMMLMLASLVDYPLRTPTLAVVFVVFCFWMTPVKRAPIAVDDVAPGNESV